jgi:hypothetical protein
MSYLTINHDIYENISNLFSLNDFIVVSSLISTIRYLILSIRRKRKIVLPKICYNIIFEDEMHYVNQQLYIYSKTVEDIFQ